MPVRRGIVASVVRTLSFHVATFAFAFVRAVLLAASGLLTLLVVGCLLVGSSQFARKLTRILWKIELAIDGLVADEDELWPALRRCGSSQSRESAAQGPVLGEVTLPVMLLSLLYFLVFKWILDLIFSVVPLVLWVVSIAQVLPKDAGLSDVNIVSTGTTAAQVFAAVAFAFLAHQLGVTSARGLLFVSRSVAGMLFSRSEREECSEQSRDGAVLIESRIGQEERHIGAAASNNYGTMGGKHSRSRQGSGNVSVSNEKQSAEAVTRNLYEERRSGSDSNILRTRGPRDMKQQPASFDGAYVAPGMSSIPSERPLPHAERAFQEDMDHDHDQEFQMCCCKVIIKSDAKGTDGSDGQHGSGGRGGRGGGGRGNSRGGLTWGRGRGRDGLRFDQMRLDMRGRSPFPAFNGEYSPWDPRWREQWLEHWSHWHGWRWPHIDQRRQRKDRRGRRRRNSFDDMYAVAVPVATTLSDAEDDMVKKEPAHKSMYEALDLTPSAPPLSSQPPRRGSFDSHLVPDFREQGDNDRHHRDSMHKSWSEPIGRQEYSHGSEAMGTSESDEDESDDDFQQPGSKKDDTRSVLLRGQHQHTGSSSKSALRGKREVAGEADGEWVDDKLHQKHAEWKQRRYERKVQKYEQKLRAAQEKLEKRREEHVGRKERSIDARERDKYAREIEQAADEAFQARGTTMQMQLQSSGDAKASAPRHTTPVAPPVPTAPVVPPAAPPAPVAPPVRRAPVKSTGGDPRKRALSSRVRGRPSTLSDHQVRSSSDTAEQLDRVERDEQENKRSVSIAPVSQAGSSRDISDLEILGHYGNIAREYEDDDVTNMRAYAPLSYTDSPPQYITALDTSPIYRGSSEQPDYDSFSPMNSPRSSGVGRGSFEADHDYDLLSPTNSIHDAEFPTDKFQQVYRSIQMAAVPEPRQAASTIVAEEGGLDAKSEFKGVPGRRDRVNFSAFAPPSVCPSPKPFQFTVWAFLLNQRSEMQEIAKSDHPEARKLSLESKLDVRRGALVHVTLEVPNGFEVLNGATQGFAWEGEISSVDYDVVCTEGAAFGRVLFKARITVGSSVAVLNSFVLVGSHVMDTSELEADVLEGWMDVMEQTYREIPFRSLEMKELVGQGYFGDAYRASLNGQDVVVKTIRASEFGETTSQIVREFQHEAAMLNMFGHHPCIVPFVGASTDTKFPLALVTKYLPYGSLEDNLRGSSSLSIDERTGMLKDAAAGLLNIHEGGFIHRDLAARNCLVDQGNHVRICDFGLCRRVRSETAGMVMKDAVGPVKYMAPESLQPPHAFSYDSDVYMFGVLMWETYTSSQPFASLTPVEAMMHVLRGERLPVPKELPESLQNLMQNCFHDSPAERPSMQEVLTALDHSLISSQRASAAIAARTAVATASANAATSTAMAKSVASRSNQQDRSIWV
ncbi:serine/threonine protein kinase [Phytophthora nicotianae]|uniref:Serine/threonine protein kinase n=1 Tax=Phytophthora nicotianae TaxID=4792 RepID=W2KAC7_PHYNI|nr:serine/threonine protein kinase [Phytophthora nicotianae]